MAENGNGATASDPQKLALLERAFVNLQSVFDDRVRYGASIGMSYNGQRDIYSALGWHTYLSFDDFYLKYQRQDIAGRIVDLPVDACWRDGFELQDDENKPDVDTPFIKSWKALDKRLGLAAWLTKLDRLSGIGRYGVLYLGVRNQDPVTPLAKTNEQALSYLSVFVEPNALIDSYDTDLASERFGLPVTYSLKTNDFSGADRVGARQTRSSRSAQVHWSRCIHCAEMTEDVKTLGTPRLQRVFNLLEALQLVTGGSSEAFWRSARPRYHANVGKEAQGFISPEELEGLGDQLAKMVHNYQDWIRTSYTTVDQLAATPADPSGHVAVILDLMSSAVAIPKRILLGSERGELASSQDAMEWAHRIAERQQSHVEPNIIRPFIDRLVEAGIMPEPSQGEYEIQWPDLTGPSADQRATLADRVASAEARHAQAEMLGKPSITRNELRELLGLDAIDAMDEEVPGETPPLPSAPEKPAPVLPGQPGQPGTKPGAPGQVPPPGAKPEATPAKAAAGWDESKHPRVPGGSGDPSGEWTDEGSGGGNGKSAATEYNAIGNGYSAEKRPEVLTALMNYRFAGVSINHYLRTGELPDSSGFGFDDKAKMKAVVAKLDSAFQPSPQGMVVYRGFHHSTHMTGKVMSDAAFISTTTDRSIAQKNFARGGSGAMVEIHVPAGYRTLHMGKASGHETIDEREVLLARGTKFKVVKASGDHMVLQVVA